MQEMDPTYEQDDPAGRRRPADLSRRTLRRLLYIAFAALAILLLVLLPPLISLNRYQRRIASSISESLGRPVHLDKVASNLLPLPGFTLENFVVDEDPAFGNEPVIRAASVNATLRISSLWSRRVEFSTISFTDPSVNLVHLSNGKWNLDNILLHAAHIDAAPTAQKKRGPAPRFPYIEATGARLNLKLDNEKTPVSLTDADFALWLPDPQQWHLRLRAAPPAPTPTSPTPAPSPSKAPSVAPTLSAKSPSASAANGATSPSARPASFSSVATPTSAAISPSPPTSRGPSATAPSRLASRLAGARRADFVPAEPLDVDLQCLGTATGDFHAFRTSTAAGLPPAPPPHPPSPSPSASSTSATPGPPPIEIATPGLPAATLLDWLRIASSRVPADITASGTLTGSPLLSS